MKLEQQILKYENDFFKKEFCDNIQNLNNRIHDELLPASVFGEILANNFPELSLMNICHFSCH